MPCFVPPQHRHLKWHVIRMWLVPEEPPTFYERAEWVNCEENGPTQGGHWVRWGKTGDFPSLCKAIYIGPSVDQDSPYTVIDEELRSIRETTELNR